MTHMLRATRFNMFRYSPLVIVFLTACDSNDCTYPVTTEQVKLVASDGGQNFGWSLSLSGDTALVGADYDRIEGNQAQGSAYIFVRDESTWSEQTKLVAPDGTESDHFGGSVSLSGDTVLIGSRYADIGTNEDQGSVYVFVRDGTAWVQQAKLVASDGQTADKFGAVILFSENRALVMNSPSDVNGYPKEGAAYVFVRNGSSWTQEAKLVPADAVLGDIYGSSLSLFGDTALVGASRSNIGANVAQGSVYVFVHDGTTWSEQAKLVAEDGTANDGFGASVALSGDTALVGALGDNDHSGSARAFVRRGTTWTQQAKFTSDAGSGEDGFGASVALSGDTALVGAFTDTIGPNVFQGSAYIFMRNGTTWTRKAKLLANDGAKDDIFGNAVALSGNKALVGANQSTPGGSAYVFTIEETFVAPCSDGAE